MTIHLVTTGGTIEKIYSEQTGQVENLTAKIDRYLQLLRLPDTRIEVVPLAGFAPTRQSRCCHIIELALRQLASACSEPALPGQQRSSP